MSSMTTSYNAFEISPVPEPRPNAVAPELFRGIYGMPSFVTIQTQSLSISSDFWIRGLGFFELFSIPGQLVHLRRWAFQDVLLVPDPGLPTHTSSSPDLSTSKRPSSGATSDSQALSVSFACVLNQLDDIAHAVESVLPGSAPEPKDTVWNTRDLEILTPEKVRVIFTAAKPYAQGSEAARALMDVGIEPSWAQHDEQ